jgi:DNA mismatch repair protein MutL
MMAVAGYTSRIGADRPNRQGQVLFVNGRLVRSPALGAAWSTAYGGKIMSGRFPYGVLMLSLAPGDVDVNVHPTKIEVRFVSAATVFDLVHRCVVEALRTPDSGERSAPRSLDIAVSFANGETSERALPALSLIGGTQPLETQTGQSARALGQIDRTFIVMSDDSGLLIVDQHAAHERIAYEVLETQNPVQQSTPLLLPRIVELTPDQATTLEANAQELAAAGIEIERFGDNAYRISALPSGYGERHFDIAAILDDLGADDRSNSNKAAGEHLRQRRQRLLATVACHSVVRAHEALTPQEQVTLYERLRNCHDPHTCPHGRPTTLRLDAVGLAKAFKRT